MRSLNTVMTAFVEFLSNPDHKSRLETAPVQNTRYKTSMCRDFSAKGSCPRGNTCTFAHSQDELERWVCGYSWYVHVCPVWEVLLAQEIKTREIWFPVRFVFQMVYHINLFLWYKVYDDVLSLEQCIWISLHDTVSPASPVSWEISSVLP